jgi:imidazolonepropionase
MPVGVPRKEFVAEICGPALQTVMDEALAQSVDAFCEGIAFTAEETETLFKAATAHGIPVKLHADQLSDSNGAALAARYGAISADHLEFTNEAGIAAMASSGTVAVLLPTAFYFLRETKVPPIELLRRHGVPIAIASDFNPGSAPVLSLLAAMNMACTLFRLTPEEVLAGVTRNAARALGSQEAFGTLDIGKSADYAVWPISHPSELCYWMGGLKPRHVNRGVFRMTRVFSLR